MRLRRLASRDPGLSLSSRPMMKRMMELPQRLYRFDGFVLDPLNLRLTANGEKRSLEPKSFRLLQFLIENRSRVVSKDEILRVVWEEVAVTDNALTRAVTQIRKALEDDPKHPRFIETIPTVGYRFTGHVTEMADPLPAASEPPPALAPPPVRRFSWRPVAVIAAASVAVILGGVWLAKRSSSSNRRVVAIRQITRSPAADLWPSFSPDGSQVAYSSNRSGQFEVYIRSLAPDGAERQVTSDGQENIQPAWSPDGQYLAYVSRLHGGIRIIPASGGPRRYVSDTGDSPQWSPDSRKLVIREFGPNLNPGGEGTPVDTGSILALVDPAGGPARPLTDPKAPPFNPSSPRWLADGRHVVFASASPGSLRSDRSGLWVVDVESRALYNLAVGAVPRFPVFSPDARDLNFADYAARVPGIWRAKTGADWKIKSAEPLIPLEGAYAENLTLSSDGARIAFSRRTGESAIWSVTVDARGVASGEPAPLFRDRSYRNLSAHFSSDGSKIAWNSVQADRMGVIYVANADGSSPVAITTANQNAGRPQWVGKELTLAYQTQWNGEPSYWITPLQGKPERVNLALDLKHADRLRLSSDGTMVTAHVSTPEGLQVVTTPLHGSAVRTLTPASRSIGFPCWSPDGRWIAAEERKQGRTTVVVIPSGGGEIRTVASEFTQYYAYDWAPDSDRIVFAGLRDGVWNVYWISLSTEKVEQLTHFTTQSGFVGYTSWSPKGDRILFERNDMASNIYLADLNSLDP